MILKKLMSDGTEGLSASEVEKKLKTELGTIPIITSITIMSDPPKTVQTLEEVFEELGI